MKNKNVKLSGILNSQIDLIWEKILPLLEKTLAFCDCKYNIKDIYNCLKNKDMQLWVAYENNKLLSFAITQIINYPTHKRLCMLFMGGKEMFKWLHFFHDLKKWATEQGCTVIEGYGRPGWEKAVKALGFEKIHTIFKYNI